MRYFVAILGLLLVIGGLGLIKFAQVSSLIEMGEQAKAAGPPPEAVSTTHARSETWEDTLYSIATVAPVQGVAVSNESPGVVTRIRFESGDEVKQGEVLVELDTAVERAQLASSKSRRELAGVNARRSQKLHASNVLAQEQLDQAVATLETAQADYAALRAQVERKIIRAPFSGRLGIREVNLGQYLNPGTTVSVLETTGAVYVDFTLPQHNLPSLRVGMPVRVSVEGAPDFAATGSIAALDSQLDDATRSVRLRATIANDDNRLKPGMFVTVNVILPNEQSVVVVPSTAIATAPYGDSVFVVEEKKPGSPGMDRTKSGETVHVARQQFVQVGRARGDFVSVTRGLESGREVVTAGVFKLHNGAPIVVDNSVQATPHEKPQLENR